ncbi:hypothetical protein HJC23_000944 [Cyclotella cryptica]|eukprot:CCRYP_004061-RA/>CCRYP_004061-RA protein AED:0.38 eAED:-0.86 QI:0/-1/0/1/-1/1/1/0/1155
MSDEIDDLETIRARIREEARQRRYDQFLRCRSARSRSQSGISKDDGSSSESSSRSSSPDLLASPPPSTLVEPDKKKEDHAARCSSDVSRVTKSSQRTQDPYNSQQVSRSDSVDVGTSEQKLAAVQATQSPGHRSEKSSESTKRVQLKRKKRFGYESSSSSEEDDEEIAKRISARMASRQPVKTTTGAFKSEISMVNTNASTPLWANSDSDSSTDIISRRRAQLKKSKDAGSCNKNSKVKQSRHPEDEFDDFTPKVSNESQMKEVVCDSAQVYCDKILARNTTGSPYQSENQNISREIISDAHATSGPYSCSEMLAKNKIRTASGSDVQQTESKRSGTNSTMLASGFSVSVNKTAPAAKHEEFMCRDENHTQQSQGKLTVRQVNPEMTLLEQDTCFSKDAFRQQSKESIPALNNSPSLAQTNKSDAGAPACNPTRDDEDNFEPIIANHTSTPSSVQWSVHKQCIIVRTMKGNGNEITPRTKVAGFDLDQTLVQWRCSGWPNRPEHYELWSNKVITKLRTLHDDGYKLVIFSNQGGIRGAFQGKNATRVKGIIDWIANLIDRPLFAVCSTKKDGGYHKGNPGMWAVMENVCNDGVEARPDLSFFVGDADGSGGNAIDPKQREYQAEGVDKMFAENVGQLRGVVMNFFTPDNFFGRSNAGSRRALATIGSSPRLSKEVIASRASLLGGYIGSPVLLVLCGVQGSGKTTVGQFLANDNPSWRHYSQDTICNGRPGKRQAVEAATIASLNEGISVVVDRMHLDPEQRSHFIKIGKQCNVQVHALVMMASKEEVHERVMKRSNHPGKVEGEHGARIAVASLAKLTIPTYEEGLDLISYTHETYGLLVRAYRRMSSTRDDSCTSQSCVSKTLELYNCGRKSFPMITLGTMAINKRDVHSVVSQAVQQGIESIDTAPTYNNESEVGDALNNTPSVKVIIKVPKRVSSSSEARREVEKSLKLLGRSFADVILLHWPSDLIEGDSLPSVWKELEAIKKGGMCHILGVSNFSVDALRLLLSSCEIKPAINQVERHPLLPQYDLLEYCQSQSIAVQAHTPLGHGNKLLLEHQTVLEVARNSGMSPAQVLLSWNLQQGVPVVTKFTSKEHSRDVTPLLQTEISLSPLHMKAIDHIGLSAVEPIRFVAPPFMYKPGALYSWGNNPPKRG